MPGIHKVDLVGQEVVAEELGVSSQAISNWYKREAEAVSRGLPDWGMPTPTYVNYRPGKTPMKIWRRAQLSVWQKWHEKHLIEQGAHIARKKAR